MIIFQVERLTGCKAARERCRRITRVANAPVVYPVNDITTQDSSILKRDRQHDVTCRHETTFYFALARKDACSKNIFSALQRPHLVLRKEHEHKCTRSKDRPLMQQQCSQHLQRLPCQPQHPLLNPLRIIVCVLLCVLSSTTLVLTSWKSLPKILSHSPLSQSLTLQWISL